MSEIAVNDMVLPKRKPNRLQQYDYSSPRVYFITICTKQIGQSYHDHIVRDETDYQGIYDYITHNPQKWQEDCFYTE